MIMPSKDGKFQAGKDALGDDFYLGYEMDYSKGEYDIFIEDSKLGEAMHLYKGDSFNVAFMAYGSISVIADWILEQQKKRKE